MNILVTGGLGYIGRHVVDKLCSQGHEVFIIDKEDHQGIKSDLLCLYVNVNILIADIFDVDMAHYCLTNNIECVVHLASGVGDNIDYERDIYKLSTVVWSGAVDAGCGRFINMSTAAAGTMSHISDTHVYSYAMCNYMFEYRLNKWVDNTPKVFNLRLHNTYGHSRKLAFSKHKNSLWFNLVKTIADGDNVITLTTDTGDERGTVTRDWINIFDVSEIVSRFATHDTRHYYHRDHWDIGSGVPMSAYNFTRSFILSEDVILEIKYVPSEITDMKVQIAKPERTYEYLDFRSGVGPRIYSNSYLNSAYLS